VQEAHGRLGGDADARREGDVPLIVADERTGSKEGTTESQRAWRKRKKRVFTAEDAVSAEKECRGKR
jgi:hypothetical protein